MSSAERVRQVERPGCRLLVDQPGHESARLRPDAAHQLYDPGVVGTREVEHVVGGVAELCVGHGQLLLVRVPGHAALRPPLEALGHLVLDGGRGQGQCLRRVLELVEHLPLDDLPRLVHGLEILRLLELLPVE